MDGSQEEAVEVRKVGFPASHVKMIRKEQNLVVEKTLLRGLNKDADLPVPHVKLTKGGKVHELGI